MSIVFSFGVIWILTFLVTLFTIIDMISLREKKIKNVFMENLYMLNLTPLSVIIGSPGLATVTGGLLNKSRTPQS